jgi:gamma-D-glutamyl-L-lysine dipeptidyl-peptidase
MTEPQGVVQVSVTPMLARRSRASEQVSQAVLGTRVGLGEVGPQWLRIVTPDGYEGWAPARAIGRRPYPAAGDVAEIGDLWANLRPRPDPRAPSWITAFIGCRLNVRGREEGWTGLELPDGRSAWVESHRLRPAMPAAPPDAAAVVATADRFLGVPYLWGGCTPLGLDCSGFVQLVFALAGVPLPRDAHQQAACGEPAVSESLLPGDLLFFGEAGSDTARVTHVALSRGGMEFVHARGGRGVQVDRLTDEAYGARFLSARRILPHCV